MSDLRWLTAAEGARRLRDGTLTIHPIGIDTINCAASSSFGFARNARP